MNPLARLTRFVSGTLTLITTFVMWSSSTCIAYAQYSDNLKDIDYQYAERHVTPIGDLGNIDVVADLRGFVPMSFHSWTAKKEAGSFSGASFANQFKNLRSFLIGVDLARWYKVPTKKALLMLYSGDIALPHIADDATNLGTRLRNTKFIDESDARGETAEWCKFAYALAKDSKPLYQQIAGSGFEAAEPTTVFLTHQSAFIILSFRYSGLENESTGQVLVALEFSRSLKGYKTFYQLYSTQDMNETNSDALAKTAPMVAKVLAQFF